MIIALILVWHVWESSVLALGEILRITIGDVINIWINE